MDNFEFFIVEVPDIGPSHLFTFTAGQRREFLSQLAVSLDRSNKTADGEVYAFQGRRIMLQSEIQGMRFDMGDGHTELVALPH